LISIKILLVINTILLYTASFYTFFQYRKNPTTIAVKYLFYFAILYAISISLLLLRNIIPNFFSIVIANTLAAASIIYIYLAVKAIVGIEHRWENRYFIPIAVMFICSFIFTHIFFSTDMRFLIYFPLIGLFLGLCAYTFYNYRSSEYKLFDSISLGIFVIGAFVFFSLILYTILKDISSYLLNYTNSNIVTSASIYVLLLAIWAMVAVRYRIKP
jgi:hypothetical protein